MRKFQGKPSNPNRIEFLHLFQILYHQNHIQEIKISLPPIRWTLADVWEVREEIVRLKVEKQIRFFGFAKEGGLASLLLLSACDEVYLNENAEFQLSLPSAEPSFYGDFLKTWGIEIEAFASGPFKSFAESFTRNSFSKEAKQNISQLIEELQSKILKALQEKISNHESIFYQPFLSASSLLACGFANGIAKEEDFFSEEKPFTDESALPRWKAASDFRFFPKRRAFLSIVPLEGGITAGDFQEENRELGKISAYPSIKLLQSLREDANVKAVILEIDSPGGSAFHSELLYQEIKQLREKKPVFAYFRNTAASGGYYIASATEAIYASPICITGSIGAVSIRANIKKLYNKFKIKKEPIGFYPFREIHSEYTPLTTKSKQLLHEEIRRVELQFYNRVKEGRGFTDADLKSLGGGRVYLPKKENKVVDELGGIFQLIQTIKTKLGTERMFISYELPIYHIRSEIPLLGRFFRNQRHLQESFQFLESHLLNRVLYYLPIRIQY